MRKQLAGLALLLLLLGFSALQVAADDKKPALTAEEIISKHLAAVGGKEALARFKTRIAIGTVKRENDPDSKMAIMSEAPNRISAVFVFPSYDLRFTYNGSNATLQPQIPRQFAVFESKYREIVASGLMFNSISLYNILLQPPESVKFQAKGTKKIKGRETYAVEVKRSKGDAMRLYFDAETFMWVRTDYGKTHVTAEIKPFTNDPVSRGEDDLTVDFYIETSDFRDVDGIKLPFRFEQVVTYPILRQARSGTIIGTITEYRHNEAIDPQMFQ
ncbi:MAG TPA: hypothetical protein VF553_06605 [Pyrinomonadaceae bacterium]|jgi:hypothetical protein